MLASAGLRRHHRQSRSARPTGRAWIGSPLQKPPQVVGQLPRRGVAPARLLGHRLQADRLQVAGDVVVEAPRAARLVVQHLVQQHPRRAAERQLAGQQLVEDHAQAVDVAAAVDAVRLAPGLLGAHVGRRAQHLAVDRHRDLARLALGQAEVHQVRPAVAVEHDVDGLTSRWTTPCSWAYCSASATAATSSAASRGGGRLADSRSASVTPSTKSLTRYGQPSRLADLVDRHDRRMPQLGDAAGLAQEPLDVAFAGHLPRSRNLDRHDAVELRVAGLVHRAEGARPHQIDELVAAEPPLDFTRAPLGRRVRVKLDAQAAGGADEFCRRWILGQLDGTLATRAEDRAHFRRVAAECRRRGGNGVNRPLSHKAAAAFVRFEERINPAAKGHIVPARGG